MRGQHLNTLEALALCAAAVALVIAPACGGDESDAPPLQPTGSTGPGAGGPGGGPAGGAGGAGATTGTGGFVEESCEDAAATPIEVYAAGSNLGLKQLVPVADRWLASGPQGYVFFDRDGSNADAAPTKLADDYNVVSSEGQVGGIAAANDHWVGYQRLGPTGPVFGIRSLDNLDPDGVTTAATSAGDALTVWGWNGKLTARLVDASGGVPNEAFDVMHGAYSSALRLRSTGRDDRIGLSWYGSENIGIFETWFRPLSAGGPLADPTMLHQTEVQHDLLGLVATDDGFVVLITDSDLTPRMFLLDGDGAPTGDSVALPGVATAYGLASRGDAVAVLARRTTGEPQLRVFATGLVENGAEPLGPWVCLAPPQSPNVAPAIAPDGAGYAAMFETSDGATMLIRVDATGTGTP